MDHRSAGQRMGPVLHRQLRLPQGVCAVPAVPTDRPDSWQWLYQIGRAGRQVEVQPHTCGPYLARAGSHPQAYQRRMPQIGGHLSQGSHWHWALLQPWHQTVICQYPLGSALGQCMARGVYAIPPHGAQPLSCSRRWEQGVAVSLAPLITQVNSTDKQLCLSLLARTPGLLSICFLTWILSCSR